MDYKPWMDYIKPEDMPNDDLKFVAESAGIRSALALIFCTPGLTVTIPKNSFSGVKERYIVSQYDGTKYTLNRLAIECGFSQRYIYKIIKKHYEEKMQQKSEIFFITYFLLQCPDIEVFFDIIILPEDKHAGIRKTKTFI